MSQEWDTAPLAGLSFAIGSRTAAADLAAFVLRDLGARTVAASDGAADLADAGVNVRRSAVLLSPYGATGRFAGAPDHHAAIGAVGGALLGQYTYAPGPAYLVSPYATVGQALLATAAACAARLGGAGGEPLPVSGIQGLFAVQAGFYCFGAEPEPQRFAHSPRGQSPTYSTYRAADDWIFIGASTTPFMIKVLQTVGLDSLLDDPRLHGGARGLRDPELAGEVWQRMDPIVRREPLDAWLARFEAAKVPAGPVLSLEETLAHPQIRAAGLAEPGEPIGRLTRMSAVTRRGDGVPRTAAGSGPLPLSGLRVVELAGYIAGSYVGRLLADLGADVVKIEPPDGDPFRVNGLGFPAWNHGKRALSLNLRDAAGRDRLTALVAGADMLVTNYRPEALTRMGVGRDDLFAVNPALIHCTVSAFGESGPLAHLPGFDPVVQAFAGIMKRQGGEGEPVKPQMAATDYLSGMLGAIGVLAARLAQLQRGGGYEVRTSLLAAALLLNYAAYEDVRAGRAYLVGGRDFKGPRPLHGLHQTRDGWLLTAADEEAAPNAAAERYLAGHLVQETTEAAIARLAALGVPSIPCIHPYDLSAEPHFSENRLWLRIEQPELGPLTLPAPVLGPPGDGAPAPALGEHNGLADVWRAGPAAVPVRGASPRFG
ncbi:MAG TPA: CoA transferase [Dehalococcoidia bacterium]|nr:CoA transferase [Dehalococcoidia bacterium]